MYYLQERKQNVKHEKNLISTKNVDHVNVEEHLNTEREQQSILRKKCRFSDRYVSRS